MTSLAENHELRGRKLWISFFNITFPIISPYISMEFRFFLYLCCQIINNKFLSV